ncbi:putative Tricarboxylate carrier [Trypanosoma vivax]|uniref:Putative tricarboxylate carrier n=1 Tax=Trypanosoma vivax (strain Y486) TaxID=1055687 RepID=G0U221_TRYVY|nr:putative tricarboxylate carrier [Trypanosoma vivax]KAH8618750.1 putative Tricarboxylate carrier [Trypanosoma vivax]CCC50324.1 putative tricarboxylate carrier [Trypanosoma vivax Y486]
MFSCPPFSLTKPRYDMDTYAGRTLYFFSTTNPLLCFETAASLRRHKELLDRVAAGEKVEASNKYLWKARTAVDICVHPTTGDVIFPLFRMCAFLPVNSFIIPFMMAPSTIRSVPRTVFIQWFNQSYNSAVNYANRSSDKQPVWGLITAYAAAVSVSVAGALAATAAMNRVQGGTMKATFLRATLPFIAVSSGSIVNLAMMRKNEWMPSGSGLKVTDEDGETRGLSRAAGVDSLLRCSFTRVVWNVLSMVLPLLFVPPLTSSFAFARANAALVEGALQISSLAVGVPMALGAFSTTVFISPNRLESEFQELKRRDGTPVKIFSYYKGL